MTDPNRTGAAEQSMTLFDACPPPLTAGQYDVTVRQTVLRGGKEISGKPTGPTGKPTGPTFKKTSAFWVSAPRFTLPLSEIYAMYPPADGHGRFAEALPHVVLRRRTLPWERQLAAAPLKPARPWMALLLLDEDELGLKAEVSLKPESRPLKEVFGLRRDPWERDDDRCLALDLPLALFQAIAPAWEDLPYLAHARRVGTTAHMEADGIEDEGWFSVVVGNRQPSPGKEHGVYLVSLEGLEDWLPRESGPPPAASPPATVRLVVLASWRFFDDTQGKGFRELVTGLACAPMRLPGRANRGSSSANAPDAGSGPANAPGSGSGQPNTPDVSPGAPVGSADKEVQTALELGYAPVEHRTRQGYRTVSWYRGPLVPLFLPTDPQNVVNSCADAALRYDRYHGLLDVSYAAAWQLGRLLGLQNQHFARAIHRLKLGAIQKAAEAAARKTLSDRFGADRASHWNDVVVAFLQSHPLSQGEGAPHTDGGPALDRPDPYAELRGALEEQGKKVELPLEVREFLGRLFLLHGVPLGYLVPHPEMLEKESLRIFYLDTSWIGALIDGALSIGRVSESPLLLDKAMAGTFLKDVVRDEIGAGLVQADRLKADGADLGDPSIKEVVGHLTGFLLRSDLISGWRGVEIRAEDETKRLRALRLQRVARDTMLAIYDGQVKRLVITQPPQGVHFGFAGPGSVDWRGTSRVVQMRQLATRRDQADKPAQFAGEMLVKRVEHTIDVTIETGKPGSP
jgi:hypothetical protein